MRDLDDAIAYSTATPYGLSSGIVTRSLEHALRAVKGIRAGTVNVNEGYAAAWASVDSPMGGYKDSGLGRRHGEDGIVKYTEEQTVAVQRLLPIAPPPMVGQRLWGKSMTWALRLLRRIPGVR